MTSPPTPDPRRLPGIRKDLPAPTDSRLIHHADQLDFDPTAPLRDTCWTMLSQQVKDRIGQRSGEIIEWWACRREPETRPFAVVIGREAVVFAHPRYSSEHRPVYELRAAELDPGSLQESPVIEHRPPRRKARRGPPVAQSPGPPADTVVEGLDAATRGVLGNLPPRVQKAMQAPFLASRVRDHDCHYEGLEDRLDMFGIVLVGARHMTLARGTRLIPVGHDDASAHWSLKFYLASVIRLRGI
jgi:hypothetical protein